MYKNTVYKLILILILFLPWINADYTDQITPVELVQEDNSFLKYIRARFLLSSL